jgi:DNA (cytosine-5)-methyltransferase 1
VLVLTFGSLFSGIGGIDLGFERAGMTCIWQAENDPHASAVLAKHWPAVPNLGDVASIDWSSVERPAVLCGGFPCQDISILGGGAGLAGEHSGLWTHFADAIRVLEPRWVVVENAGAFPLRGLAEVLAQLAGMRYDAEWDCIPAAAVGAPHLRARTWVLAYPRGDRPGLEEEALLAGGPRVVDSGRWPAEPPIRRVDDGLSGRVDRRLKQLGLAAVPQVAELVGQVIVEAESSRVAG